MPKKEFTYFCGFCNKEFERELTISHGIIEKGQQVKCDVGHFIPTLSFIK